MSVETQKRFHEDCEMNNIIDLSAPCDVAETACRLLRDWGLESALSFLYSQIRRFKPIDSLHCVVHDVRRGNSHVIAEVGFGQKRVAHTTPKYSSHLYYGKDTLEAYIADDMKTDPLFSGLYTPGHTYRSFMRIPIFDEGGCICCLGLWAEESRFFDCQDLENLSAQLISFGEMAAELILPSISLYTQKKTEKPDIFATLEMCPDLKDVVLSMQKAAESGSLVLITGESGTGKSLMAQAIHERSNRAKRPFVSVNCGAIPSDLLGSQLFGHERGSFTGAVSQHKGFFEQANGGTLFLDEIAEIPMTEQAHLLHVLDNRTITRIGGSRPIPLDIRIIAATNKDLQEMVRRGTFREDLYFRLLGYPIHIPPLRLRKRDIHILLRYYLLQKTEEMGIGFISLPDEEEMKKLLAYRWPGNVRELSHAVERALLDARHANGVRELHFSFLAGKDTGSEAKPENGAPSMPSYEGKSMDDVIREYMCAMLEKTGGRIFGPDGAAALMRVHPNTVKNKMIRYGIRMEKQVSIR